MLSEDEGKGLVRLARLAVKNKNVQNANGLGMRKGVFVTIYSHPNKDLRGCIGFVKADGPLHDYVQKAAISSAFYDTRFPALEDGELDKIVFEVNVLTEPQLIEVNDPRDYYRNIEIGKDGLIIQNGNYYGLLLPSVPMEQNWSVEEFLENLCFKADLTPDFIFHKDTKIWKFQTQVFSEKEPNGEIVGIKTSES